LTIRKFLKTYTANALTLSNKNRLFNCILLTVVVFLLILLKPFGLHHISFMTSVGYWVLICLAGACLYIPVFYFGEKFLLRQQLPYPLVLILLAVFAGFLMCFIVAFIISVYFDVPAEYMARLPTLFPHTLLIGGILISVSMGLVTTLNIKMT